MFTGVPYASSHKSQAIQPIHKKNHNPIHNMGFFSSLSADHPQRYFRIIQEGLAVRRHSDLLRWLQGEIQHYLPHEIMVAAWGDFGSESPSYDIVSALPGVRTAYSEPAGLSPLLAGTL